MGSQEVTKSGSQEVTKRRKQGGRQLLERQVVVCPDGRIFKLLLSFIQYFFTQNIGGHGMQPTEVAKRCNKLGSPQASGMTSHRVHRASSQHTTALAIRSYFSRKSAVKKRVTSNSSRAVWCSSQPPSPSLSRAAIHQTLPRHIDINAIRLNVPHSNQRHLKTHHTVYCGSASEAVAQNCSSADHEIGRSPSII